jgi:hypothetical protein
MEPSTLATLIQDALDWDKMNTKSGDTQKSERYYIDVISQIFSDHGMEFDAAPSQCSVDFRMKTGVNYEAKKINKSGARIILNDTLIKDDVYYICMCVDTRKVLVVSGSEMIDFQNEEVRDHKYDVRRLLTCLMDYHDDKIEIGVVVTHILDFLYYSVLAKKLSLLQFGELFKRTYTFGNVKSRPRPNWSIALKW